MSRTEPTERFLAGEVVDGVLQGGAACAVDIEHLLLVQGWRFLEVRSTGLAQRVAIAPALHRRDASVRLTPRQFQLARLLARGMATKAAAAELALTAATARTVAGRVVRKLELRTSAQLPAFWFAMSGTGRRFELASGALLVFESRLEQSALPPDLTPSERTVLHCLIEGCTNHCISKRRGTSVRTTANQVAAILRKLGVSSRGELVFRVLEASTRRGPVGDGGGACRG